MKMKLKEHNGTTVLVVSGTRQQLVIMEEEDGCFSVEAVSIALNIPAQGFAPAPAPVPMQEEEQPNDMPPPADDGLFAKLALLRKSLAAANEVPPYLIFHDKTLHEMVDKLPANMRDMGHISGVGQAKLEKYGPVFLDVINGVAA